MRSNQVVKPLVLQNKKFVLVAHSVRVTVHEYATYLCSFTKANVKLIFNTEEITSFIDF